MVQVTHEGQLYGFGRDIDGKSFWYHVDGDNANIIVSMVLSRELTVLASCLGHDIGTAKPKAKRIPVEKNKRKSGSRRPGVIYISLQ